MDSVLIIILVILSIPRIQILVPLSALNRQRMPRQMLDLPGKSGHKKCRDLVN